MNDYHFHRKESLLQILNDPDRALHTGKNQPGNQMAVQDDIHEEIRINLETLLNSRRKYPLHISGFDALSRSLLRHGLPDFMHSQYGNHIMQENLRREIQELIVLFEPRILEPCVILLTSDAEQMRLLKLIIEGNLKGWMQQGKSIFESSIDFTTHRIIFDR